MTVMPAFISLFFVQLMLVIANGAIPTALKPKHNIMGAHPTGLAYLQTIVSHMIM